MKYKCEIVDFRDGYKEVKITPFIPKSISAEDAIECSILKWKTIVDYYVAGNKNYLDDGGVDTCGLCRKYFDNNCQGCPVYIATKEYCCDGSFYRVFEYAQENNDYTLILDSAKKELAFLKSLRTKEK